MPNTFSGSRMTPILAEQTYHTIRQYQEPLFEKAILSSMWHHCHKPQDSEFARFENGGCYNNTIPKCPVQPKLKPGTKIYKDWENNTNRAVKACIFH